MGLAMELALLNLIITLTTFHRLFKQCNVSVFEGAFKHFRSIVTFLLLNFPHGNMQLPHPSALKTLFRTP